MDVSGSFNPSQIGGDYQGYDSNSIGGSERLLSKLEESVAYTLGLGQKDNILGSSGQELAQKINPQDVVRAMAEISGQSLPGVNFSAVG
ncbi:MAG: hypothetical protein KJ732_07250 [Candidatus Margulisbacteria bacterium]|nr:hypothetical protein [Candidatus Margulisiibacteriota bacterium]